MKSIARGTAVVIITAATLAAAHAPAGQNAADARFEQALASANQLPRLHSLLVSVRGQLVVERYYNGASATRAANVKSVAKSIISALVGIALERRLIADVDTPIVTYF